MAKRLVDALVEKERSLSKAAKALDYSPAYLCYLRKGLRTPSVTFLRIVAERFPDLDDLVMEIIFHREGKG